MPTGSPNAGYKTFNTGDVLTAAQVQYNLQNQSIMYFADDVARDAALTPSIVQEGMACYLASDKSVSIYNGTSWVSFAGDITALTAGTGIEITNPGGPVPTIALADNPTLTSPKETISIVNAASTGTINIDILTASVEYYTLDATTNFTLNVRGDGSTSLDSLMSNGQQISVVYLNKNGATAYYPDFFQIDGVNQTPKWLGGTAPVAGNINSIDSYVYTIIKTGAAAFTVLASQNKFA